MKFTGKLIEGMLIRRYKRFLADVELVGGEVITVHTANTGSMTGCSEPGSTVWLSKSDNPKRKYPLSWELVEVKPTVLVGINTLLSNKLVEEAINAGLVVSLAGYSTIRREVRYGIENSRIDLLLESDLAPDCYVEVKNVTLIKGGTALFPDAVTERGTKHLRELAEMVRQGKRAVIFYCIQRSDAVEFRPATEIDPLYAKTLTEAVEAGVEALAYSAEVTSDEVRLVSQVPVMIG
jgi:sugar fermentation stimulation protein A